MLGIITGNRPSRLDCLEMSRLATALLCHSPCLLHCYSQCIIFALHASSCYCSFLPQLLWWIAIQMYHICIACKFLLPLSSATAPLEDCYSNVLYLHCIQILAIALLFHSLCSAQQQQPLFQITPVHNINMYKAILANTPLRLFSCVTALGGLLFTVPLTIPSFLFSSLYHYSYMLHSLDAYEI